MGRLVAVSPVGKNGQAVVPASIRKMFKMASGRNLIGFYLEGDHVEIAPVSVVREKAGYSTVDLDKLDRLAMARGGRRFKTAKAAKKYLAQL
jgi:bifunctional DNA-binding transcriptional regulator/antitoxin component of YhaV-PrlF toxin-antitoxin module